MSENIHFDGRDRNEDGRIISVQLAPGFERFAERVAQAKAAQTPTPADEDAPGQPDIDVFDAVQILTDEQIENIVMAHEPGEDDTVARFFFQELFRRDEKHAMEVFRRWRNRGE